MDVLKQNLMAGGIKFSEIRFTSDDGIKDIDILVSMQLSLLYLHKHT